MQENSLKNNHITPLLLLILISTLVRGFFASIIELGNDEVYYRIFALFPQLSYYDHPPLLSQLIRLTTFAGHDANELLIRMGSIIIGAVNTYIIYSIARKPIFDSSFSIATASERERRGFLAALLYTGSIYASVITGLFIMPDTPLSLFWLLALNCLVDILPKSTDLQKFSHKKMLLAGAFIGLAMLSKYSGLYLWGAAGLYILLFNRTIFSKWSLYVAPLITIIIFLPVIIWNIENEFISFTFHGARIVSDQDQSINWLAFGRELIGGMLYNNPINYFLIITAFVGYLKCRGGKFITKEGFRLVLCFSLPMIFMFLYISLSRDTLPHWSAPGYFALIILASSYLSSIKQTIALHWVRSSVILLALLLIIGSTQINLGWLMGATDTESPKTLGSSDVSLDMYGWREFEQKFSKIYQQDIQDGVMPDHNVSMYSALWFEAAHLDCYVALKNNILLKTIAPIEDSHLYEWITNWRGGVNKDEPSYMVATSRFFMTQSLLFKELGINETTSNIEIPIYRNNEIVQYFYIYRINPLK